jgi:hypothetical protein
MYFSKTARCSVTRLEGILRVEGGGPPRPGGEK